MRVRTGYELVVAHRTGESFAYIAQRDGTIEALNDELKLVKVRYDSKARRPLDMAGLTISKEAALARLAEKEPIYIIRAKPSKFDANTEVVTFENYLLRVSEMSTYADVESFSGRDELTKDDIEKLKQHPTWVVIRLDITVDTGDVDIFQFGTKYTSISGSYLRQTIVLNAVVGDRIKRGDVLAYNSGFFEPDPTSKQVTWKHGVMANVVLMENDHTLEDSNAISASFSKKMLMHPAHIRTIQLTNKTTLHSIVDIGEHVETTDMLCVIEDSDIDAMTLLDDPATVQILSELNRKAPKAKYHGRVAEIDVLYSCPIETMHPSMVELIKRVNTHKSKLSKAARTTGKADYYPEPSEVVVGTKYRGVEFTKDTVVIMFTIEGELDHGCGDKLVCDGALKSITAHVLAEQPTTESGLEIDMVFGGRSVNNRIILSPLITGTTERVLARIEDTVVDMYFSGS